MSKSLSIALATAICNTLGLLLVTCASPKMPALDGAIVEVRRSDDALQPGESGYESTLQLFWFGSSCHVIQLGDLRVLLDPFVTNELKLSAMRSNPVRVAETMGRVAAPDVVLVNHSHHDHILDGYAAMSLPSWRAKAVPMYGGQSCRNLMAGWGDEEVLERCRAVADQGGALTGLPAGIKVTAYRTRHTPHLKCGFTLADGLIEEPMTRPPHKLLDFQSGETFNYLVEMRTGGKSFTIFYLGAPYHLDEMPDSLPPAGTRIDVAIMLAPTAKNARGYPQEHLAILRPRHIVLSHFNSFVTEDPDAQNSIVGIDFVGLADLSRDFQAAFANETVSYPEFEKMHIPAITRIEEDGATRNVIRIR
jgi:L-ascorbate metabolism protein UlaG (beta-lactamase superfamily)